MKTKFIEQTVNGMKVVVYPMRGVQAVMLRLIIRAGSWAEPGPQWGKMHLLEHMTFNGTAKFPEVMDIEAFKEENGISGNAWTGNAHMGFWFEFPRSSFEEGLEILKEVVFHASIPERHLAREKKVIEQEYTDKWSNPYARYSRARNKQFCGENHLYLRDGMGNPEFVNTLTIEDLKAAREKFFIPENMYLAIVGNVKVDRSLKAVEEIVSEGYKGTPSKWQFGPVNPSYSPLFHKEDVDQVGINLRWQTQGRDQLTLVERMVLARAAYILGGSARSRLFRTLRIERGLVYKTGASIDLDPSVGEFEVWCSTNKKDAPEAKALMLETVERFASEPLDKKEYKRGNKYMNMQNLMAYDSVSNIADATGNSLFWNGRVIPPEEFVETSKAIKPEDVTAAMQKILKQEPLLAVLTKEEISL